jgi:hypothetical protein
LGAFEELPVVLLPKVFRAKIDGSFSILSSATPGGELRVTRIVAIEPPAPPAVPFQREFSDA